MTRWIKRK